MHHFTSPRSPLTKLPLLVVALLPALVACESVESDEIDTEGMWASFSAVANGDGKTTTEATLKVGGGASNTFVNLEGDDTLTVAAGGETKTLEEWNLGDIYGYRATWDTDAADTEFTFAFTRTEKTSAPSSTVVLPDPFAISAPAASAIVIRGTDAIVVTWDASDDADPMHLSLNGDCIKGYSETVTGDPGTFTIAADKIETQDDKETESCEGTISLERVRGGTLDPAFEEGGVVEAKQTRSVKIRLDP